LDIRIKNIHLGLGELPLFASPVAEGDGDLFLPPQVRIWSTGIVVMMAMAMLCGTRIRYTPKLEFGQLASRRTGIHLVAASME
jgi:hypothetical protein